MNGNRMDHILLMPSGGEVHIARGRFIPAPAHRRRSAE